jgi:hypothetical protein
MPEHPACRDIKVISDINSVQNNFCGKNEYFTKPFDDKHLNLVEYWSDGVMHPMFFTNTPLLHVSGLIKPLSAGLLNGFQAH